MIIWRMQIQKYSSWNLHWLAAHQFHTANEGPVRIQYKWLVAIYVFPEMKLLFPKQNYNVLSPRSYSTLIYLWEIYIFPRSVCLFCCREICRPILGIYKWRTDTWLWKFRLRPRNSQKRNTKVEFSLQCTWANHLCKLPSLKKDGPLPPPPALVRETPVRSNL
jgi:hypothetical protein